MVFLFSMYINEFFTWSSGGKHHSLNTNQLLMLDFLIRQTLIPTMQTKGCVVTMRTPDILYVQISRSTTGIACKSLIIAVRELPHKYVTLMVTDEGHVKQRRALNADFPMHILTIRNTRHDCFYHLNGWHWWSEDQERGSVYMTWDTNHDLQSSICREICQGV